MSYFVDVYSSLAEWMSCVERLLTFDAHMDHMLRETEKNRAIWRGKKEVHPSSSPTSPFACLRAKHCSPPCPAPFRKEKR